MLQSITEAERRLTSNLRQAYCMGNDTGQQPEIEDISPGESIRSQVDLDVALSRRRSRFVRLLIGAVVVALVVAVIASQWRTLTSRWQQPVSTPLAPATALVLGSVSRGTVVFNGKKLAYHDGVVVSLHQGKNTFTFESPPFNARRCTLTWPSGADSDNCHGAGQNGTFYPDHPAIQNNGKTVHVDYVIALPFSLSDLPEQLQQQAIGAVKQSLAREAAADQATVQPGEHYAASIDAKGITTAAVATEPLIATPLLTLDTNGAAYGCPDVICGGTGAPNQLLHLPATGPLQWAVGVTLILGWRFTTPSGKTVASIQLLGRGGLGLTLEWMNGSAEWQIVPSSDSASQASQGDGMRLEIANGICNAGMEMLTEIPQQLNGGSYSTYTVEGCRISGARATFIWRFGALLAADETTHRQAPQLPLATPSERAAIPAN